MRLKVNKWAEFQHYKTRRPPWIKLYKRILDDYEFMRLSVASKALAPLLWLLASESEDGSIEADPSRIAFRVRMDEKVVTESLKELIAKGFLLDASNALAKCLQDACLETETETETEKPSAPSDSANHSALKVSWTESGFQIPESIMAGFITAFPAVDVRAEIAKAHAWVLANPKNRKSQWGRFLNGWLQRGQDRAPVRRAEAQPFAGVL